MDLLIHYFLMACRIMSTKDLYHDDFHAWALEQAELLRAASRVHAPWHDGIDFELISSEIEDLGHSCRRDVEINLEVALRHIIKVVALPNSETANHLRTEINSSLDTAVDVYSDSMNQYLDMNKLWIKARKRAMAPPHTRG